MHFLLRKLFKKKNILVFFANNRILKLRTVIFLELSLLYYAAPCPPAFYIYTTPVRQRGPVTSVLQF